MTQYLHTVQDSGFARFRKSQGNGFFLGNHGKHREIVEHIREICKMSGKSKGLCLAVTDFSADLWQSLYMVQVL